MRKALGTFFLCCIRSTEANKQANSIRKMIRLLEADTAGRMIAMQRRIDLIEGDYQRLVERLDQLEAKRGKRG